MYVRTYNTLLIKLDKDKSVIITTTARTMLMENVIIEEVKLKQKSWKGRQAG